MLAGGVATRRHAIVRIRTILLGVVLFAVMTVFGILRQVMRPLLTRGASYE
jgi:flagellar biosynthesis/type III secretory pathway M-ring protein FliF/YscJ